MSEYIDADALQTQLERKEVDVALGVRCKYCKYLVSVNTNGKGIPICQLSGMEVARYCPFEVMVREMTEVTINNERQNN